MVDLEIYYVFKASRPAYNANALCQRQLYLVVSRDNPENVKIPEKQSKKANFLIIQNQQLTFAQDTVHTANTWNAGTVL